MSEGSLTADDARTELYEIMKQDASFEEKAEQALEVGESYLGVDNGHITRINTNTDVWEAIASTDPPEGTYPPGLVLDLNTTYCRRTITQDSPIALHDAPEQGWEDDPAFEEHGLHCYHGTTITINDEAFGTVCFVSETPRERPFENDETLFAELIARMLEHELMHTRQRDTLNLKNNLIGVLSRVLRHNLRNDLTVVNGHLNLLAEEVPDGTELVDTALTKIEELVELSETARQIESIASSETDKQAIDLDALVGEIIDNIESEYPSASFTVEAADTATIEASPSLRTALVELIENATKHAGNDPDVTVSIDPSPNAVDIHVIDNGPGLPPQEQKVLREGTESPLVHGSGLGLWVTYWIVSNQDGSMEATQTDDGTQITVTLPRKQLPSELSDSEHLLQEFHREQDRFEAVFEESFDAMAILDDDGHYIDVNDSTTDLFGLPKRELLGLSIDKFLPDEFRTEEAWERFQTLEEERGTFPLRRADGSERTVEYSAVADIIPGEHLAILRDVTERIERQEALRETSQHLEAIIEASPDPIIALDTEGRVQLWNEAAEEVFGYTEEEVLDQSLPSLNIYGEDDINAFEERFQRALEGETFTDLELRRRTKDGEQVWLSVSTAPLRANDGSITGLMAVAKDISDQRRQQETLQTRQRVLREMHDIMADRHRPFTEKVDDLLELGRSELDTAYGSLSKIKGDEYIFEIVDAADESIEAGDVVPVSATNCEIVADTQRTLVLGDVARDAPEETDRAGYTDWGITCYIGAPVYVDDEVYGTFCFYGTEARDEQFSKWEVTLVDLMSQWVSDELQYRQATEWQRTPES